MRNEARKTFAWLVVSILITTCRAQSVPGPTCVGQFDFQPWLEDFGQLTAEMAAHYANLESSQRERHMDVPKLRQETETKLRQACDEQQAPSRTQMAQALGSENSRPNLVEFNLRAEATILMPPPGLQALLDARRRLFATPGLYKLCRR